MPRPVLPSLPLAPLLAALLGAVALSAAPDLERSLFAQGAARLASLLHPGPVRPRPEGWQIGPPDAARPVLVTEECAATDFFLLVAVLLAWRLAARGPGVPSAGKSACVTLRALVLALPLTLGVNALRIVAVVAAHTWLIPLLPAAYADFAHLLVGVAVFLPALLLIDFFATRSFHARHLRLAPPLAHA